MNKFEISEDKQLEFAQQKVTQSVARFESAMSRLNDSVRGTAQSLQAKQKTALWVAAGVAGVYLVYKGFSTYHEAKYGRPWWHRIFGEV